MKKSILKYLSTQVVIFLLITAIGFAQVNSATLAALTADPTLHISSLAGNRAVITWLTDSSVTGQVRYGTGTPDRVAEDERGAGTTAVTHYVVLTGLVPATTYFFDLVSGGLVDDNGGMHYTFTTGPDLGLPPPDPGAYGRVLMPDGITPADALLYLRLIDGDSSGSSGQSAEIASYAGTGGYWVADLISARVEDLSGYFAYGNGDQIAINAVAGGGCTGTMIVDVGNHYPAPDLVLSCQVAAVHVSPAAIDETVEEGQMVMSLLTVENGGDASLTYTATSGPTSWLGVDPTSGTLPPGASAALQVTLDAFDLVPGLYTSVITLTHNAPGSPLQVPVMLTVTSAPTYTLTIPISQSSDDAGPSSTCGYSTTLNEVYLGSCTGGQSITSGLRFANVTIPRGAHIEEAHVEFTVDGTYQNNVNVAFFGESTDDAQTFSSTDKPSDRPLTAVSIPWAIPSTDVWLSGQTRTSPDLTEIVQEIIDRPGWSSDNALAIIMQGASSGGWFSGHRRVFAYDRYSSSQQAAHLVLTYTAQAPIASFDANPLSGTVPLTVTFTDASQGAITEWLWDYGDGTTSAISDTLHTHLYSTPGVYTVSLTVANSGLSNTLVVPHYITVTQPQLESVVPDRGWQDTAVDVVLTGRDTHWNSTTTVDFGPGITATFTVTDATHAAAHLILGANAPVGNRTVSMATDLEIVTLANGFRVEPNLPPDTPGSPLPTDGATNVFSDTLLAWAGGDPDLNAVAFDVYLDTTNPPSTIICSGTVITACTPPPLTAESLYYWQVVATDEHGASTAGPIWSFTTISSDACQITWQAAITLMDNGARSQLLSFGQGATATDGLDPDCGEERRPPPPPAGSFDARFQLPTGDGSFVDLRPADRDEVTWRADFQPGSGGYPFILTWNPAELPTGSVFLRDPFGGVLFDVDMRAQSSYTITNPAVDSVRISFSKDVCFDVEGDAGWNMVGVPVLATDMRLINLFPDVSTPVYRYGNDGYEAVNEQDELEPGQGYWMWFDAAMTSQICGRPVALQDIPVSAGWNMLTPFDAAVYVDAITSTPGEILSPPLYAYDGVYIAVDLLDSGDGYWAYALEAGVLHMAGSGPLGGLADPRGAMCKVEQGAAGCSKLWEMDVTVGDASGASQILTIGQALGAGDGLDPACGEIRLPLSPPPGGFDARLRLPSGTEDSYVDIRALSSGTVEWHLVYQAKIDPITLSWDPTALPSTGSMRLMDSFGGVIVNVDMALQSSLVVPFPGLALKIVYTTDRCLVTAVVTGDWSNAGIWDSTCGAPPEATDDVLIAAGVTVAIDVAPVAMASLTLEEGSSLLLASTGDLVVNDNVSNEGGTVDLNTRGDLTVGGRLANSGTLHQEQEVSDLPLAFLGSGDYGGVELNSMDASKPLGDTRVTIHGAQDCTGGDAQAQPSVHRCFDIEPAYPVDRDARLRLYFSASELGDIPCAEVQVWHWHGSMWSTAGTVVSRQCEAEPYYIEVEHVTEFSSFVIDDNAPNPKPTAVTLVYFEAVPDGATIDLVWETASEIKTLGFNLYRSTSRAGEYVQVNDEIIPAHVLPGSQGGSLYSWEDRNVGWDITYYYELEEVDVYGIKTRHGPVSAVITYPQRHVVYLPLINK